MIWKILSYDFYFSIPYLKLTFMASKIFFNKLMYSSPQYAYLYVNQLLGRGQFCTFESDSDPFQTVMRLCTKIGVSKRISADLPNGHEFTHAIKLKHVACQRATRYRSHIINVTVGRERFGETLAISAAYLQMFWGKTKNRVIGSYRCVPRRNKVWSIDPITGSIEGTGVLETPPIKPKVRCWVKLLRGANRL